MLQLFCPHCGEHREEEEFHYKGQAHIARPTDPDGCSDQEWGEYLYFRKNPRGIHHEGLGTRGGLPQIFQCH